MSAVAPRHPLITQTPELLQKDIDKTENTIRWMTVAQVVSVVALVALAAGILTVAILGLATTAPVSLALTAASLLVTTCIAIPFTLENKKKIQRDKLSLYKATQAIFTKNQAHTLLEARYMAYQERVEKLLKEVNELQAPYKNKTNADVNLEAWDRAQVLTHDLIEKHILPLIFNQAFLKYVERNPTVEGNLEDLGHFVTMESGERARAASAGRDFPYFEITNKGNILLSELVGKTRIGNEYQFGIDFLLTPQQIAERFANNPAPSPIG